MTLDNAIKNANHWFNTHIATRTVNGPFETITWRRADGFSHYNIRYVFDTEANTLTISGDLGYAVVQPTEKACLRTLSHYINSVDYFAEKIKTATDLYEYSPDAARAAMHEYLIDNENLNASEQQEIEDFIDDLLDEAFYTDTGFTLSDTQYHQLSKYDSDAFEWIGHCGREYHLRVYLWLIGMQQAYAQLRDTIQESVNP